MTDGLARPQLAQGAAQTYRPAVAGLRHVVVAGHYLAAHAGFAILEAGGSKGRLKAR